MQSLVQLPVDFAQLTGKIFPTKISNQSQLMKVSNAYLKSGFEIMISLCTKNYQHNFEPLSKLNPEALDRLWILMSIIIRKSYMQLPRRVMKFSKSKF